jgi:hypothetical protein
VSSEFFSDKFCPLSDKKLGIFGKKNLGVNSTNFYNMWGKKLPILQNHPPKKNKAKQKQKSCM